jgi:hypothetical protein
MFHVHHIDSMEATLTHSFTRQEIEPDFEDVTDDIIETVQFLEASPPYPSESAPPLEMLVPANTVSILASFCVWIKLLVCNDAPQGFYYSEMLQSQKIFSSLSAVRTIEPSHPDDHLSLFHPSGRRAIPSGLQTDQASSVRTTCLFVRTLHCVEKVLSSLHPSGHFSSTSGLLSVLDQFQISFQVPRKGRSINRPDDVVSRPNAGLLKARIAIQKSPFGRLTAVVWTPVHQRRKLSIRLQPSRRLPIMVRTCALQI